MQAVTSQNTVNYTQNAMSPNAMDYMPDNITCDWNMLSSQILSQWQDITPEELEVTMRDRHLIALLVERKYGIHAVLTENYLKNLERTLPRFN